MVAEDIETQPFCSRGQIGKFFLVSGAHALSPGIRWPQPFGGSPQSTTVLPTSQRPFNSMWPITLRRQNTAP
jgi:hypothetical protein